MRPLARRRLLDRLADRWERRLVTVVAGPGFGKTALLVAALHDVAPGGLRRDVWLSCEPSDRSGAGLVRDVTASYRLDGTPDLDWLIDSVWAEAPSQVCFVLDNVHEIAPSSEGARVLRRLVDDLPANGHLVLSSRDRVPVPTARLAASGQLTRLREDDLVLDADELEEFARLHGVAVDVLASSGGWPALAELTASAGADLVGDYVWEEVLANIGDERAALLARFAVVGGGDDELVSALADRPVKVADLVAGIPLVERGTGDWAALHPLWDPPLRRVLDRDGAEAALGRAAEVHVRRARFDSALSLLVEAEAWERVLGVLRTAALSPVTPIFLGRWYAELPAALRERPEALLAAGFDIATRSRLEALAVFRVAAEAFRARGDNEGEMAAVYQEGIGRWVIGDYIGLFELYQRVAELAATGLPNAQTLDGIARAALGHISGDSAAVFAALASVPGDIPVEWRGASDWLRSVAHRRDGDLPAAYAVLDGYGNARADLDEPQAYIARLRTDWLRGDIDSVVRGLPRVAAYYADRDRFLWAESTLEQAAKVAWLGDLPVARHLLAGLTEADITGALQRVLHLIATAAIAVGEGDEERAAALLAASAEATAGRGESWYWRDRAAFVLPFVLLPDDREKWAREPLGPAHLPGLTLGRALVGAREGDLDAVRELRWPEPGAVRAHVPRRWAVELVAAGLAAGNPAPADLLAAIGAPARSDLRAYIDRGPGAALEAAARSILASVPATPAYRLRLSVVGPLELWRDGDAVSHPHLRRQRVRELLCALACRRRIRREELADLIWPDILDASRNLRTTLAYVQQVLQPDRSDGEPPYFLRTEGAWLRLADDDRLDVDTWELDRRLDEADAAERANAPSNALDAYRAALPLWRGEPFADADGLWAHAERVRLRARYTAAAVRAGELMLAVGDQDAAVRAAQAGLGADRAGEPAYHLLVRAHLSLGDRAVARATVESCRASLAELGLEPSAGLVALV